MMKKVLIILITILVGICLGYLIFVLVNKNKNTNIDQRINELITSHNQINKIFEKVDKTKFYYNDRGTKCLAYKNNDAKEYIEKIKQTYYYTLDGNDVFEIEQNDLYICVPDYCKTIDIDEDEINIINEDETTKTMHYKAENISVVKDNNSWKFGAPILECDFSKKINN